MAHDLPRAPETIYAVRNVVTNRFLRCDYSDAYRHWKGGGTVYTKNGNGTRSERAARDWEPVDPPA